MDHTTNFCAARIRTIVRMKHRRGGTSCSATAHFTVPQLFRSTQLRGGSTSVAPTDKIFWIYLSPSMHVRLQNRVSFYGGHMYLNAGHIVFLNLISGVLPHE